MLSHDQIFDKDIRALWDLITSPTRFISPYTPKNDIKTTYIMFLMFTDFIASLPFENLCFGYGINW